MVCDKIRIYILYHILSWSRWEWLSHPGCTVNALKNRVKRLRATYGLNKAKKKKGWASKSSSGFKKAQLEKQAKEEEGGMKKEKEEDGGLKKEMDDTYDVESFYADEESAAGH